MNVGSPEAAVLELAVEDAFGLWEIPDYLRDLNPLASQADLLAAAMAAVSALAESGFVQLLRGGLGMPEAQITLTELREQPMEALFGLPDGTRQEYRVLATERGEEEYAKLRSQAKRT